MDELTVKSCGCGRAFTRAQWDQLNRLPDWPVDDAVACEVRNCTCGSTLLLVDASCSASLVNAAAATGAVGHHLLGES
jgi:hypothetical protein